MRFFLLSLLLSACGQAGDLYLPSDPAAGPSAVPASEPAPVAADKKKDAH